MSTTIETLSPIAERKEAAIKKLKKDKRFLLGTKALPKQPFSKATTLLSKAFIDYIEIIKRRKELVTLYGVQGIPRTTQNILVLNHISAIERLKAAFDQVKTCAGVLEAVGLNLPLSEAFMASLEPVLDNKTQQVNLHYTHIQFSKDEIRKLKKNLDDWGFASEDYDAYLKKLEKGYDAYFQVITPNTDIDDIYDGPLFDNPALGFNLVRPPKPIRVDIRPEDFLDDLPGGGGSGGSGGGGGGMGGGGFNIPVYKGVGDYIFTASDYIQQVLDYIKTQDMTFGLGGFYYFERTQMDSKSDTKKLKGDWSPDVQNERDHALADLFEALGWGLLPSDIFHGGMLGVLCHIISSVVRPDSPNPWPGNGSSFVDP